MLLCVNVISQIKYIDLKMNLGYYIFTKGQLILNSVKSVVYWTINQYSTACVKRWRCLEYVYSLMYCLVLLFSISLVINKQWALLNDCWINTHSWYLGFIRTHPIIYNRLCIWLAVSPYMNGCAWLRARWSCTIYHSTYLTPAVKSHQG